jgi:hypothetical protein
MATASIAALYRNTESPSSAKTRQFTYGDLLKLVRFSGAPHSVRRATLNALTARGRWPNEDGPANGIICVSLEGMMRGNEDGDGNVVRSTARWRARQAVKLRYWRQLREANSWSDCPKCGAERKRAKCEKCSYEGRSKTPEGKANFDEFCRPFMYEIDIEKFRTAPRPKGIRHSEERTYAEYKQAAKRAEIREMPTRKPAQPAPSDPPPAKAAPVQPAAEHRSTRHMSRDERAALFNAYIALKRSGMTHETALGEVVRQFKNKFSSDDVEFALKVVGHKNGRDVTQDPSRTPDVPKCMKCGSSLVQNRGPGPRLICADCPESS